MSYEIIQLCVVGLIVICVVESIRRYSSLKSINGVPLPPGSMGLPFVGEALSLFVTSYSLDVLPFLKTRLQRYGPIFQTNLLGQPMVVSADPEVNHYILNNEGTLVELWYFNAFSKIIGLDRKTMTSLGFIHKYIRKNLLNVLGVETMKRTLLAEVEVMIRKTLTSWSARGESIEIKRSFQVVLLNFLAKKFIGYDAEKSSINLSETLAIGTNNFVIFPLNLPGTTYRKCIQGKKKVFDMMRDMIKEKRERMSGGGEAEDVLDQLSHEMHTQDFINEDFVLHFIYASLLVSSETIVPVVSLAMKLLDEHPSVLEELKVENESMIKKRANPNSPLSWDEYKSLTFTHQVINEVLRLVNLLPGLLRRAVKDVTIKGVVIPAGWTIMLLTVPQHLNSNHFEDPLNFNPWRWKNLDSDVISKNFMPFGRGMRQCVGADYARVVLATFIHVFATEFRLTTVKGGKISRSPILGFGKEGFHIKFSKI